MVERRKADAGKYEVKVVFGKNYLEGFFNWPKPILAGNVLYACALRTGFVSHDSDMVRFQAAVASSRTLPAHEINSTGVINVLTTVSSNMSERFSVGIENCRSLVFFVRLTVHKEEREILYNDGDFNFTSAATTSGSKDISTLEDQIEEPDSTSGAKVCSL